MIRSSRAAVALIALSLTGLAGCGGDDDDDDKVQGANAGKTFTTPTDENADQTEVRRVFTEYNRAMADEQYGTACELLLTGAKQDIIKAARDRKVGGSDCATSLKGLLGLADPESRKGALEAVADADIGTIKITGDQADVRIRVALPGGRSYDNNYRGRKEGGKWKVAQDPR